MILCDVTKKLMYEARPDLFPQGYLTDIELELWGIYYENRKKK